jgi:small subunit ribosomal protein S5
MAERAKEKSGDKDFLDFVVSVRRVTKVTKGGKRFSFSAFVVTGDQQGNVGMALGKSKEATSAIAKATLKARKSLISIPLRDSTVSYNVVGTHGASKVIIRSACKGTGVIAGGAVRSIFLAAGVKDVLTKSVGSRNKLNSVKATLNALAKLRSVNEIAILRGKSVQEIIKGSHVRA